MPSKRDQLFGRDELEARLRRPDCGENGWAASAEPLSRLDAVGHLADLVASGAVSIEGVEGGRLGGVNTHVHTAKSFGCFGSPAEAVWAARLAGLVVFGINDHYTLAGHEEFGAACRRLGIAPTFSLEAIATWEAAAAAGETVNDPANPGRTYLTAKGVTRDFAAESRGRRDLERMNRALLERHRAMTAKLAAWVDERLGLGRLISFANVLALTPHDQPTERHIAAALAGAIEHRWPDPDERRSAIASIASSAPTKEATRRSAELQKLLRDRLLKVAGAAYVEESADAYLPIGRMVSLGLELGAIPTYPVLGNPVTPWEEDLSALFDRLEALGIHAIEVIPDRNTRERLAAIVEEACARGFPVFNGTEHNTPARTPLVDRWFFDDAFRPVFERSARVLLGHQLLRARGEVGYVLDDGSPARKTREESASRCAEAGAEDWEWARENITGRTGTG